MQYEGFSLVNISNMLQKCQAFQWICIFITILIDLIAWKSKSMENRINLFGKFIDTYGLVWIEISTKSQWLLNLSNCLFACLLVRLYSISVKSSLRLLLKHRVFFFENKNQIIHFTTLYLLYAKIYLSNG